MTETSVPNHIGFILDGNRRWARGKGLPTFEGHKKGYSILKDIAEYAFDKKVAYVSAFIFSTENWKRSKEEVGYLMDLALKMVVRDLKEMHKKNIRIVWLGTEERLDKKLVKALKNAVKLTENNTKGTLALCFNYGGKEEIVHAVRQLVKSGDIQNITENTIEKYLYTPMVPPIDIMVRTSGEQRISNFMLWRIAYSELYFVNKHWPDFSKSDLDDVVKEFNNRQRRYGG